MQEQPEQSCLTECVYCTRVRPDIGADCPVCKGQRNYQQAAQMMSPDLSRQQVLAELFLVGAGLEPLYTAAEAEQAPAARKLRQALIGTLQSMSIYNFDLETAVIELIQSLEQDFDIA